jgi:hypothetical protein
LAAVLTRAPVPRRAAIDHRLARLWPVAAGLLLAAALVLARGRPSTDSDAGIFLSVAARLLDGDRLYVDVWDNKDPLFFYTLAGALAGGDWRLPFLLDVFWLSVAAVGLYFLLRALGLSAVTASVGLVSYPVLLTGAYYYAGYSMLPALALAPVAGWVWARSRFVASGVVVAVAALYKVNLALVVASAPAALALVRRPTPSPGKPIARAFAGLAVTLLGAVAVLALLGELGGYLSTLRDNVAYADDVLAATGRPTGVYGHLWSVAGVTDYTPLLAALGLAGAAFATWALVPRGRSDDATAGLAAVFLAVGATAGLALAATAVWDHHAQLIAYPGALLAVLGARALELRVADRRWQVLGTGVVAAFVVAAFGGFTTAPGIEHGSSWRSAGHSDTATSLELARAVLGRATSGIDYAVLGTNHDEGHAAFLHGSWRLACPRFQQYTFSRHLDDIVRCLRRRHPTLVVVDSALGHAPEQTRWNAFVDGVSGLLRTLYVRLPRAERGGVEVWRLR